MGAHQLDQARVDRRPDRAGAGHPRRSLARGRRPGTNLVARLGPGFGSAEPRHVLDGHLDEELEGLAAAGVHDLDGPGLPSELASPSPAASLSAAEQARDLLERSLRGGQSDALESAALGTERLEPLERKEEMRAALGPGDGVDLVDDHGLDRHEPLACLSRATPAS